jgi:hypothetical protein
MTADDVSGSDMITVVMKLDGATQGREGKRVWFVAGSTR